MRRAVGFKFARVFILSPDKGAGWGLTLTGRAGTTYAIEASIDLAQWKTAASVVASESGTAEFVHQDAGAKCFCRAKLVSP